MQGQNCIHTLPQPFTSRAIQLLHSSENIYLGIEIGTDGGQKVGWGATRGTLGGAMNVIQTNCRRFLKNWLAKDTELGGGRVEL